MEFSIYIQEESSKITMMHSKSVGLEEVALIREKLGTELPLDRIKGDIAHCYQSNRVGITETEANKYPLIFKNKNTCNVEVKNRLEFFIKIEYKVVAKKNQTTGEILEAWIEQQLNQEELKKFLFGLLEEKATNNTDDN